LFLVALAVSSSNARIYTPEEFMAEATAAWKLYDASPLECYVKNNVTGAVNLQVCKVDKVPSNSAFHQRFAAYPACMVIKGGKNEPVLQTCLGMSSIMVLSCLKAACYESDSGFEGVSSCCCTTSGCNDGMLPNPN
ncbi:hypothetical protein PMAYCL1PPCAC_13392, partial [Pristionchus mayeri]